MGRVLAAVDFSDLTDSIIEQAELFGKALGYRVTLLHVAAPNSDFIGCEEGLDVVRDDRAKELRTEHTELLKRATELQERGVDANALLVEGPSVATILKEGSRLESDIIVIGSHGHGAIYEMLFGGVCEGVIRRSTCPVLVIPHPSRSIQHDG